MDRSFPWAHILLLLYLFGCTLAVPSIISIVDGSLEEPIDHTVCGPLPAWRNPEEHAPPLTRASCGNAIRDLEDETEGIYQDLLLFVARGKSGSEGKVTPRIYGSCILTALLSEITLPS